MPDFTMPRRVPFTFGDGRQVGRPSLTKPTPRLQPGITRSGDQPMRFSVSIECILALAV